MAEINYFNVALYGAAFLISLTNLIFTFIQQRTDKLQNKLYILVVIIVAGNAATQIVSEFAKPFVLEDNAYFTAVRICEYLYFLLHTALCPAFCLYVLSVCGGRAGMTHKRNLIYSSLFLITELLVITNPLTGLVYTFNEKREFVRGWAENLIYVAAAIYLIFSIFMLLFTWNALTMKRRLALIYFFLLVVAGVVVQFINIKIKSELFAEALALLGGMTAIESEDDRIDIDTGIYNRKALQTDLSSFIVNNRSFCLICLKVTNADLVERATGSYNSDRLPMAVATFLRTLVPRYCVYSTSPGTFIITVMDPSEEKALAMSFTIIKRFDEPWVFGDTELMLNAVIMEAKVPERIKSASDAFYMADCPVPKNSDKKILSGSDLDFLMRRAAVENAVNQGFEEHNFEVYYQPTFNLADKSLHGAEALIRLHDGVLGSIFPDEFIPIAEQIGVIDAIDDFVLKEVCEFIASGIPAKYGIKTINVNLSVIECMQPGFVKHINTVTDKYRISKEAINFEITESVAASDYELLSKVVTALKNDGFHFSMDDYGTGYSNIRAIFMLDFDVVKIDKSILWSAEESEMGKIILENSVRMIKQMKREILVEGVETQEQINLLSTLAVDYLQGYFFSRPIPKDEFIKLISTYSEQLALSQATKPDKEK